MDYQVALICFGFLEVRIACKQSRRNRKSHKALKMARPTRFERVTFAFGGSRLSLMTRGILRTFGLAVRPTVGEFIAHDSKVPVGGHITLANFNALSASCPSPPAVAFGVKRTSIGR